MTIPRYHFLTTGTLALLALAGNTMTWAQQPPAAPSAAASIAALGATPAADASLYNDLGGVEVIRQIVDDLLALSQADQRIKQTFTHSDTKRVAKMLTEQICQLSGGPCQYSGDPMKEVHQGLRLSNAQFNALVEDLQMAMDKSRIASRTQNKLLALLAPMQRVIVSK